MKPQNAVRLDRTVGRLVYRFHRGVYRLTNGRIGERAEGRTMLLLTTTGRVSGKPRETPLMTMPDGRDYYVVASNAGRPDPPNWLRNIEADPRVSVQVGRRRFPAKAHVLDDGERAGIWPRLTAYYKGWAHYETLTDRRIPVVRLSPED